MYPLTLPSRREQPSQIKPLLMSFDCSYEHTPEHFFEVCELVEAEADAPNSQLFGHRWLDRSWPLEEQEEENDSANSLIFDEISESCPV